MARRRASGSRAGRRTDRRAPAPSPPRAAPAIGWPPMNGDRRHAAAAATIAPLGAADVGDDGARRDMRGQARRAARCSRAPAPRGRPDPRRRRRARPVTRRRSATISIDGHRRDAACAIEPPIRPNPTIAMRLKTGRSLSAPQSASRNRASASLDSPSAARHRLEADAAADRRRDDPQLRHQAIELRREHRLRAVAERVVGIAVHLDDQAVARRRRPRRAPSAPPCRACRSRGSDRR